MSKVIIIGGGASGLVAAITARRNGNDVTILEKNNKCGKKILITGNGHCNYLNDDFTCNHYRSTDVSLLEPLINENSKDKIITFFKNIGIEPHIKNGYYYPLSNQSVSIQNALLMEAKRIGVKIICDTEVRNISYKNNFIIETTSDKYLADKVILATGTSAGNGSDYGYGALQKFGHTLIKPLPALVQLYSDNKICNDWAGIRSDAVLNLIINGNIIAKESGEVMLTNYGISGICAMQFSGRINRSLDEDIIPEVSIDFVPTISLNMDYMEGRSKMLPDRNIVELLEGLVNYKLLLALFKETGIDSNCKWISLNENDKLKVINTIKKFRININGTKDFKDAQVCSGGIPLNEVNIETMESLKQNGLYITGELLDVDGDCGGYNLGFAWLSGIIAGKSIK